MRRRRSFSSLLIESGLRPEAAFLILLLVGGGLCRAAAQDDPPPDPPVGPIILGGRAATRLLLSQPKPAYPPLARLNYIQGRVEVEVNVTREGRVSRAHVIRGHAFLAASTLETIRHWIYRPFMTRAGPEPFITHVNVHFNLEHVDPQHIPAQPESYLEREVRPPEVIAKSAAVAGGSSVRMRVLVSAQGAVIDATPLSGPPGLFATAREEVKRWGFRPARCENMPVPWYVEVDVEAPNNPDTASWP